MLYEIKQKEEDHTKVEIIVNIISDGHIILRGRLQKKDITEIAEKYGIATKKIILKGVIETWVGKPKGMLKVTFEHSLLDLDKFYIAYFSEKGSLNDARNVSNDTCLELIFSSYTDFA